MMCHIECKNQINQAIKAADQALFSLKSCQLHLKSADHWNLLMTFGQHKQLNAAKEDLSSAHQALKSLSIELDHIDVSLKEQGVLIFADYAFDGLISDILVQSHIGRSRKQISQVIRQVKKTKDQLIALSYQD